MPSKHGVILGILLTCITFFLLGIATERRRQIWERDNLAEFCTSQKFVIRSKCGE